MKRLVNKTVGVLLILLMLFSAFVGCTNSGGNSGEENNGSSGGQQLPLPDYGFVSMFPDDWTGGFMREGGHDVEYWWVETYDELMAAIDELKAHESTFLNDESLIVDYQGEMFDVKYCIQIIPAKPGTEKIKFGDDPFDRKATDIEILTWCFFEDITIDEINYGSVRLCNAFELSIGEELGEFFNDDADKYTSEILYSEVPLDDDYHCFCYIKSENPYYEYGEIDRKFLFAIRPSWNDSTVVTEKVVETVIDNLEYLDLNFNEN